MRSLKTSRPYSGVLSMLLLVFLGAALSITLFGRPQSALAATDGPFDFADNEYYSYANGIPVKCISYSVEEGLSSITSYPLTVCLHGRFTTDTTKIDLSSSNESVVSVPEEYKTYYRQEDSDYVYHYVYLNVKGPGKARITARAGQQTACIDIYVAPSYTPVRSVRQIAWNKVRISFETLPGYSGYTVFQVMPSSYDDYFYAQKIKRTTQSYIDYKPEFATTCRYIVVPDRKLLYQGETVFFNKPYDSCYVSKTTPSTYMKKLRIKEPDTRIKTIKVSGSRRASLTWVKSSWVKSYAIYGSVNENGPYKKLASLGKDAAATFTSKNLPRGAAYYMKVRYLFPDGTHLDSPSDAVWIPSSKKAKNFQKTINTKHTPYEYGSYGSNWSYPDKTTCYQAGGKLYAASISGQKLYIYRRNSKKTYSKFKTIKLGDFDTYGGLYHGTDGRFYVTLGYNNLKESDAKTVIRVIQYSSSWKKLKTAVIKGGSANSFKGIYIPIDAGNCRMDMSNGFLYILTCREMYAFSDGIHHQSNIGFKINTKTMKASVCNYDYTSHSFNQFIRLQDNDIYLSNHGDAYPRAVNLIHHKLVSKNHIKPVQTFVFYKEVFSIQGATGDNYTGLKEGGMEVGTKHVLTTGISVPQGYKVKSISGNDSSLAKNVFLTITDKKTGKTKKRWITNYNPKTSKIIVGEVRMVKLTNNRFALMYATRKGENGKPVLHYVVVNDLGQTILKKTYKGMNFTGSTQPIVYKGAIVWVGAKNVRKKNSYIDYWTGKKVYYYENTPVSTSCQIPVIVNK